MRLERLSQVIPHWRRQAAAFGLFVALFAFVWALNAHQARINARMVKAELAHMPQQAQQVVSVLLQAAARCQSIGTVELDRCRIQRWNSNDDAVAQAGLVAEMSLALLENFFLRCSRHAIDVAECKAMLTQAGFAREWSGVAVDK